MRVAEAMTRQFAVIPAQFNLTQAAEQMDKSEVGVLTVTEQGELIGILTERDIAVRAVAAGRDPRHTRVVEVMTPTVASCSRDDDLKSVARRMVEKGVRRLVVLGDGKQIVGLLSLDDLVDLDLEQAADDPQMAAETLGELPKGPDSGC